MGSIRYVGGLPVVEAGTASSAKGSFIYCNPGGTVMTDHHIVYIIGLKLALERTVVLNEYRATEKAVAAKLLLHLMTTGIVSVNPFCSEVSDFLFSFQYKILTAGSEEHSLLFYCIFCYAMIG